MKTIFYILTLLTLGTLLSAQISCEPDPFYADSTGGVYPRPVSDEWPDAGIDVVACPGQDYFFNFTVNVPDTIFLGTIPILVSRVRLRTSEPVQGLPAGLTFTCNPANCDMPRATQGCIALTGVVNSDVEPGIYPLEILVDIVTNFGLTVPTQFPNEAIAPGEYFIIVGEPDGEDCLSVSTIERISKEEITIFPNPSSGDFQILLPESIHQTLSLQVINSIGQTVAFRTEVAVSNRIADFSMSGLKPGTYLINIISGESRFTKTIILK